MAYVRKKKVKGQEYYQLVESRRVDGKPRQRVLVHLGRYPTVDAALKGWTKEIRNLHRRAKKYSDEYERQSKVVNDERLVGPTWEHVDSARRQADTLEAKLRKLRNFRKRGVA